MICRSRARCLNSSASFRMRRLALPILNTPARATGSCAVTAAWPMSRITLTIVPAFSDAAIAAATPALPLTPSWSARTRRSRSGSGQRTWAPVRRPACRLGKSHHETVSAEKYTHFTTQPLHLPLHPSQNAPPCEALCPSRSVSTIASLCSVLSGTTLGHSKAKAPCGISPVIATSKR